jgi:CDI immunity proteins
LADFGDEDLCIAVRQQLFLEHVVPVAVYRLQQNPLAGKKYDGELIVALKSVPRDYWAQQLKLRKAVKQTLDLLAHNVEPSLRSDIVDLLASLS